MGMNHTLASSARDTLPFSGPESFFPGWKQCLGQARLSAELQVTYRRGIEAYSAFCQRNRLDATVETARRFVAESTGLGSPALATVEVWKEALNWLFREGVRRCRFLVLTAHGREVGSCRHGSQVTLGISWSSLSSDEPR